ncbi:hypothetical protein [Mangrovibacterium sp.]|uniref:hypothetical protein n=1 Tax=Mangrovibacterium sp. TaxID=1961364 RepID=UPI003561D4B7
MKQLKLLLTWVGIICLISNASGQKTGNFYNQIDSSGGDFFTFKSKIKLIGPKAFYVDGSLTNEEAAKYPYVFNSLQSAVAQLSNGTETEPMTLYLAPWVYWIDAPDDPEVRVPKEGNSTPFGMEIDCEWLKFYGLSDNPYHVILAANRGQTMGAKGNFTMLNIKGDGLSAENITFGNYCNIDLKYPLNPKLNREKRGSAIVQAQLIFSNGDKVLARNCNFISRLNTGPFWGSKRTLFDRCHFEMTDDALNGSAVYLNCTFDFFSGKPFWGTSGTGAVFLNCDIRVLTRGEQYFTKSGGQVAVTDTRFSSKTSNYIGWQVEPSKETKNFQYHVSLNADSVFISPKHAYATVDMNGKPVLNAYRFTFKNEVVYNTFNLLRGNDNWDPMGIQEIVLDAEKATGKNHSFVPIQLLIEPTRKTLETGKDSLLLTTIVNRFGNYELEGEKINWSLSPKYDGLVKLESQNDGTCLVIPTNKNDETIDVTINASTHSGLAAASVLSVTPSLLQPPAFVQKPTICNNGTGKFVVGYKLDMKYEDESLVSWYRCSDAKGSNPVQISVSRFNEPMKSYELSAGDIGWYIMACVSPKHLRCLPGEPETIIYTKEVTATDVKQNPKLLVPKLENMSAAYQPKVLPGFWVLDSYAPADTHQWHWEADNSRAPWHYGAGIDGAAQDSGFVQNTKGARMRYQPLGNAFGDMRISFTAVPAKTAGQGFSSARAQYMDIGIKMAVEQMTGYALRLIRTTKYSDAIDFILMKYEAGVATPISEPVAASCYRPNCLISLEIKGNKLTAHAKNLYDYVTKHHDSKLKREVNLEAEIQSNQFGGISFQHTGTVGSGATLIKDLKVEWED